MSDDVSHQRAHWTQSLRIVRLILILWFLISLGCGVLFREFLDQTVPAIGGAPFGFWMAQQGAIIGFLMLLFLYRLLMNRIDAIHGYDEEKAE